MEKYVTGGQTDCATPASVILIKLYKGASENRFNFF